MFVRSAGSGRVLVYASGVYQVEDAARTLVALRRGAFIEEGSRPSPVG
jgi:hypothetical protein